MMKRAIDICVPGLPGAEYVWRRRRVLVTNSEWYSLQRWKLEGFKSKSAMALALYPHRVYHRSTV